MRNTHNPLLLAEVTCLVLAPVAGTVVEVCRLECSCYTKLLNVYISGFGSFQTFYSWRVGYIMFYNRCEI